MEIHPSLRPRVHLKVLENKGNKGSGAKALYHLTAQIPDDDVPE